MIYQNNNFVLSVLDSFFLGEEWGGVKSIAMANIELN